MEYAIVNSSGIVSFKRDGTFCRFETPIQSITSFIYHYFITCRWMKTFWYHYLWTLRASKTTLWNLSIGLSVDCLSWFLPSLAWLCLRKMDFMLCIQTVSYRFDFSVTFRLTFPLGSKLIFRRKSERKVSNTNWSHLYFHYFLPVDIIFERDSTRAIKSEWYLDSKCFETYQLCSVHRDKGPPLQSRTGKTLQTQINSQDPKSKHSVVTALETAKSTPNQIIIVFLLVLFGSIYVTIM